MSELSEAIWRKIPHPHKWEHRVEKGEEEHGMDYSRRFCTKCGLEQHLYYQSWNMRSWWQDAPHERAKKIMIDFDRLF